MADEHDPSRIETDTLPAAGPPPRRVEDTRAPDPGLSAGDKAHADWAGRSEDDGRTAKVGGRDVNRPTDTAAGAGETDGALHDRLARKDQTPVDEGSSSLS